jgi:hypothetical protein
MKRLLSLAAFLAAPCLFLWPAQAALAADTTIVKRDVPVAGARALATAAPKRFDLVGLHWRGSGSVEFRTRSLSGRWSAWRPAAPEDEDKPDAGSAERRRAGAWQLGNPWWAGPSNGIEYRLRGTVKALRAWFVSSPVERVPYRTLSVAGSPTIVPRPGWKADESIRRAPPTFATQLRYAVVHHTAGANAYTAAQAPAIVRAIQTYHVKGNGWNDIGYNLLVDKYGKVYEGRFGGLDKNVVGAHAEGFNTGSFGVAVLGEYTGGDVTGAAGKALADVLAWRLDLAHVDPLTTLNAISGGNQRFPSGIPVFLRAVSGHRDTGFTECPGNALYNRLGELAASAQATGLPKLYAPAVSGRLGGKIRFRARLSSTLSWTVTVSDAVGMPVASGAGTSQNVDWTWDSTLAALGGYRWRIDVPGALGATGALGGATVGLPVALAITNVAVDSETVSPNGDGVADETTLTYTLNQPATVTIRLADLVGAQLATLYTGRRPTGETAFRFEPSAFPDARYQLQVSAKADDGTEISSVAYVFVTRTLGFAEAAPAAFSPNADGRRDTIRFAFLLDQPAQVRLRVLRDGKWVATPFQGPLELGEQRLEWNGAKRIGRLLDGSYEGVLEATDAVGTSSITLPFLSDTRAPKVRILPGLPLRVWVSEPAQLTLRVNGNSMSQEVLQAGEVKIAGGAKARVVRVVAWDAAGNTSLPARRR